MERLAGRVAVITGAASGLGRALATELGREGMRLVLADVEREPLVLASKEVRAAGFDAISVLTDVSDPWSVDALAARAVDRFGAVNLLCNGASVTGQLGRTWSTSLAEWEWVVGVNVMGVVSSLRAFMPLLLDADEGHILNVGSGACFEALPGFGAHAASKHAVLGLSEALRRELHAAGAAVGVTVVLRHDADLASAMAGATDAGCCARAAVDGIKNRPISSATTPRCSTAGPSGTPARPSATSPSGRLPDGWVSAETTGGR